jgi:hypothetical protein
MATVPRALMHFMCSAYKLFSVGMWMLKVKGLVKAMEMVFVARL